MKMLAFLCRCTLQRCLVEALSASQFGVEMAVSAGECLQFARATLYEGILVDAGPLNFGDVLKLVKLLRQANRNASLFVFAHLVRRRSGRLCV
jgi:ActR/RegA family two-component response regulator